MESIRGKWAIVTGASSGIGKEFASALAQKGANLVLVARRVEPMERLARDLRAAYNVRVKVEGVDLTCQGAAGKLKDRLNGEGIAVETLINNAGLGLISEFADQSLNKITAMLQLNVVGLTELTHVFAKAMKERGRGHILLVASIAAYQPCPVYAAYAATKAYVLSLGEALHAEFAPHNVVVTALSPGVTETEFFDAAGEQPTAAMKRMMMKPRPVVEVGLAGLYRKKSSVVAGTMNRMMTLTSRLLSRHLVSRIGYNLNTKQLKH